MYTEEQLTEAVTAIMPGFAEPLKSGILYLPIACMHVASECFKENRPEDGYTTLIRRALRDLDFKGHFDYSPATQQYE